jgi:large subunit ribosomal protein L21
MFAIIQTGGKQYRVSEGDTIRVEKLEFEPGATLEFTSLLVGGEALKLASEAAKVKVAAQVVRHVKGEKVYVDKYKSGIQYRRRNGHRQQYTDVKITSLK